MARHYKTIQWALHRRTNVSVSSGIVNSRYRQEVGYAEVNPVFTPCAHKCRVVGCSPPGDWKGVIRTNVIDCVIELACLSVTESDC